MRSNPAFAALVAPLAVACLLAGCTSAGGSDPTSPVPPSTSQTLPPSSPAPSTRTFSGPPRPPTPTIPPDVPRTGPNIKPGEKPPLMPLEATQHTPAGAKSFAEFFIKTIDWGFATVSGTYVRHYAEPNCTSCSAFADGMAKVRSSNHRYIGGRITITKTSLAAKGAVSGAAYTVQVTFNILSFEELTKSGGFVKADGAHSGERFDVSLRWAQGRWVIDFLSVDA